MANINQINLTHRVRSNTIKYYQMVIPPLSIGNTTLPF
uniref:Uncharacterized protein n=1 Tax=Anguilla anguilla TaxID=7936 RepID=A0A0E9VQB8_ANGAN